ncbi:hypothetical protein PENFLA_c014G04945 [Penicillium flavigenum]|uniref:D-xylose 1-dehydrogenase (NADP(+), D-xylono-1,5-lactone-forming) n=1 Tax=Penicillium flavigenum TaxID=254877 RepID=A0A1V6T6M2_9EURO|nr:hypothetical protein PENFLA_c014G04945 [Penicillium flavigenum]
MPDLRTYPTLIFNRPLALITPALSHPEVIVQAVAARVHARASAFAKKHNIPDVRTSYDEILEDPKIDAVLIPLPNSLHFEWARSHRPLNATEAGILFNLPELLQPNAPVLLEAFHNRFHPVVHKLLSFITPADVVHVHTDSMVPWLMLDKDNIVFNYKLAGGSIMMLGTYNFSIIRMVFDDNPVECVTCEPGIFGESIHDQCDTSFKAKFRFLNGGIAEASTTMRGSILWKPATGEATHTGGDATRFIHAVIWHRVDVKDTFIIRNKDDRTPVKTWTGSKSYKAYNYKEAGGEFANLPGEDWWMSYRYQLEEFVNRVKGHSTQYWVEGKNSRDQMKMIDMAYEKSGLGLRPTSLFR